MFISQVGVGWWLGLFSRRRNEENKQKKDAVAVDSSLKLEIRLKANFEFAGLVLHPWKRSWKGVLSVANASPYLRHTRQNLYQARRPVITFAGVVPVNF
jgi:hypothetical protein